jgi:hypothetical protein
MFLQRESESTTRQRALAAALQVITAARQGQHSITPMWNFISNYRVPVAVGALALVGVGAAATYFAVTRSGKLL